jgi:hypothetical protein
MSGCKPSSCSDCLNYCLIIIALPVSVGVVEMASTVTRLSQAVVSGRWLLPSLKRFQIRAKYAAV